MRYSIKTRKGRTIKSGRGSFSRREILKSLPAGTTAVTIYK
jgi:hypothetical protein